MALFYLTNDLMFGSRVASVAQQLGLSLRMLRSVEDLLVEAKTTPCRLVLLDLTLPNIDPVDIVHRVKAEYPNTRFVAYGPHVHEALLHTALTAGCDEVLTRGQFNQQIERVLQLSSGSD